MLPAEALELLDASTIDPSKQSKVNPTFTCGEILTVVRDGVQCIHDARPDMPLEHLMEKRVYQACRNQRQPRF